MVGDIRRPRDPQRCSAGATPLRPPFRENTGSKGPLQKNRCPLSIPLSIYRGLACAPGGGDAVAKVLGDKGDRGLVAAHARSPAFLGERPIVLEQPQDHCTGPGKRGRAGLPLIQMLIGAGSDDDGANYTTVVCACARTHEFRVVRGEGKII